MSLVKQWQKGEATAFETLYLRHKDMVFRTALSMLADEAEAEDVLQMAFIRVYRSRGKFEGDESAFRRWLYRITINLCMDIFRKRRSCQRLEKMKEKGFEPACDPPDNSQEVEDTVKQAMDCLDGKHHSVVVLRYLHEMPYEKIAETLEIPLGTVKSRLNTAIRIMRKKLAEEKGVAYEL